MPPAPTPPFRAEVRADELLAALDAYAPRLKTLTLDCFDTLLFRDVHQPFDLFFAMANEPAFQRLGMTAHHRIDAEREARRNAVALRGTGEVKLANIYARENLHFEMGAAEREALIELEMAAEERTCIAFPRTVDLIRAAKNKGLQICIISDTYLSEPQLRRLLETTLPADAFAMIDRVFPSCEHGRNKVSGLFQIVLQALQEKPDQLLHIGDHQHADVLAPRALGIHTARLVHHDTATEQILRMQALAYGMQHAAARRSEPIYSPFRAVLADATRPDTAEEALGYSSLGPLLYSFARTVLDQLASFKAAGKPVKPVFLMRDGFLPQQVCNALAGEEVGPPICLSRFVSQAAALHSRESVEDYFSRFTLTQEIFEPVLKQLLFPRDVAADFAQLARRSPRPAQELTRLVLSDDILPIVLERARAYRQRLYKHLQKRAGLERGDTLLFIDLGYAGTGQRLLTPLLREDFGAEVMGNYLLVSPLPGWQEARVGLVDPSSCDDREIYALIPNVCMLEDLCTAAQPSATDFDEDGEPVEGTASPPETAQLARLKKIQRACIDFALDAQKFFARTGRPPSTAALRATGLASLTRLFFFPGEKEIACLEDFQFDFNLATDHTYRLFNRAHGLLGLQRRGLPAMEKHNQMRTNYPVEARSAHLALAVTLLATERNSVSFNRGDLTLRREAVPVVFLRGKDDALVPTEAIATYDGYYALIVPFGDGSFSAGVLFGQKYSWLQIESVQAIPSRELFTDFEAAHAIDVLPLAKMEQMVERGAGIYECSPDAFLLPRPPAKSPGGQPLACRIVYRPLKSR